MPETSTKVEVLYRPEWDEDSPNPTHRMMLRSDPKRALRGGFRSNILLAGTQPFPAGHPAHNTYKKDT
jgi:hypothetical protein